MTGLLVSVRSGEEAITALGGGAQVIDIKEPSRGSLGAADPSVWQEVCRRVGTSCTISAALGELVQDHPAERIGDLAGIRLVKIGLATCCELSDWPVRWRQVLDRLPSDVQAVAVAYADHVRAASPDPQQVLSRALDYRCGTLLIDTFDKTSGGLFDVLPSHRLEQIIQVARAGSLQIVLAGSLDEESIQQALSFAPDLIAVRGAACSGSRTNRIEHGRVRRLVELVQRCSGTTSSFSGTTGGRP